MKIAFRCDASVEIGSGHLMRCLTLADELKRRGAECVFVCALSTAPWNGAITARGHSLKRLDLAPSPSVVPAETAPHAAWLPWGWETDAAATISALPQPVDWLVVDHYALDQRWEERLRPKANRIMAIDDLADRPHTCDLLLDHNVSNLGVERYEGHLPHPCQRMLGPAFALIHPDFAKASPDRAVSHAPQKLLLFLTAGDPLNLTSAILRRLMTERWSSLAVDVVTGAINPHLAEVQSLCAARPETTLHIDTTNMPQLCTSANLAIGAAGGAALERCASALPSLTLVLADNQRLGADALKVLGGLELLHQSASEDLDSLDEQLDALITNGPHRRRLGTRGTVLVDGLGTGRVADAIMAGKPSLHLRLATLADAQWLLDMRNDPVTRAASLTTATIPFDTHMAWLDNTLSNPDRLLLIGMIADNAVGTIRFDCDDADAATVSIALAPQAQGQGLSVELLRQGELWALAHQPSIQTVTAVIRTDNSRSRRLFEKAEYVPVNEDAETLTYCKRV